MTMAVSSELREIDIFKMESQRKRQLQSINSPDKPHYDCINFRVRCWRSESFSPSIVETLSLLRQV
jgi:hypothetical protein